MDKREAIRRFIRDNRKTFFMNPFPSGPFKEIKKSFFLKRAKIQPPRDTEIASELLEMMIDSSQVSGLEQLEDLWKRYPFMRDNVVNKQYFVEKIQMKQTTPGFNLDLEKVREAERLGETLEQLRAEAEQHAEERASEKLMDLQERIRQHEERLAELRGHTVMDGPDFSFPEEIPVEAEEDAEAHGLEWWEKLDLKDNPFPDLNAESTLPIFREYYDAITYKTKLFSDYQTRIEKAPRDLFRNTMFHGQYGSGKTHLFRYLEQKLILNGYETAYILFSFQDDLRSLYAYFGKELYQQLAQRYQIKSGETLPSDSDDIEGATLGLLRRFQNKYQTKGVIVFLDDLHKGNLEAGLDFINRLQPFTAKLRLALPSIGFFISGHPDMERMMENNLKYSGSVSRVEHMPEIDVGIACLAFNLRFKTYAKNPENPKQIERRAIERTFAALKIVTFRQVIDKVIRAFEKGDFEALTVDPIRIPAATLEAIKKLMDENSRFKNNINLLTYGKLNGRIPTPEQRTICLDKLCAVYNRKQFPQSEVSAADLAFFQALFRSGLIDSRPSREGNMLFVTAPFARVTQDVFKKFGLSPDQYLKRIYGKVGERAREDKRKNPELTLVDNFVSALPQGGVRDCVQAARDMHKDILAKNEIYLTSEEAIQVLELCSKSLATLTRAYKSFERIPIIEGESDDSQIEFWKGFWRDDIATAVQEYLRLKGRTDDRKSLLYAVETYGRIFLMKFEFLKKQYDDATKIPIPLLDLKNSEIKVLNTCREAWIVGDYAAAARDLNGLIERRIRTILFDAFTLLYGPRDERMKWVDKETRGYILKGLKEEQEKGLTATANEFNFLNRGQYKLVMTGSKGNSAEGRRNWNAIFADVFHPWSEQDLYNYLDAFADYNIGTSHNFFEKFGADQPSAVFEAIIRSEKFLSSANRAYQRLLDSEHSRIEANENSLRFSFSKFSDMNTTSPISIDKEEQQALPKSYADRKFEVALDDQYRVQSSFGMGYREFYAVLASLLKEADQGSSPKGKLKLASKRGSEVKFQFAS